MLKFYKNHKNIFLMILGLLIVSLIALPYAILGQGSYVEVHDQLDGEVLNYIYQAKYLFSAGPIKEFMNGADASAMLPPAPLGVLFYKLLPPFSAFALMHEVELVVAFLGMYFLIMECKCRTEIAFLCGVLFAYLPFYPVYGLSAYGQPLLLLAFMLLAKGKRGMPLLIILFIAFFSSFSLIGYAFVGIAFLCVLVMLLLKKKKEAVSVLIGSIVLFVGYVAVNLDLLSSMFSSNFVSHRTEMTLTPITNVFGKMLELLLVGGAYSKVYSGAVLTGVVLLLLFRGMIALQQKNKLAQSEEELTAISSKIKRNDFTLILGTAVLVLGSLLSALWNGQMMVLFRETVGGPLPYFQADRIYWMFPFVWMVLFAIVLEEIVLFAEMSIAGGMFAGKKNLVAIPVWIAVVMLALLQGAFLFRDNTINKNFRLVLLKQYHQVTWESIYMDDVFAQLEGDLDPDKENYSVVSLGLYPSIPLYHGYVCADGYSNNYDLNYKHAFRGIVARELEKDEYSKWYFDEWGNRLYLLAQPYGVNGSVGKDNTQAYVDPQFSLQTMAEMNIKYIFAAAPIIYTSKDILDEGYELRAVREEPYESEKSYYRIWVYELVKQ